LEELIADLDAKGETFLLQGEWVDLASAASAHHWENQSLQILMTAGAYWHGDESSRNSNVFI
jgi:threonyl-tRNA synthetase